MMKTLATRIRRVHGWEVLMHFSLHSSSLIRSVIPATLAVLMACPPGVRALDDHLMTTQNLQQETMKAQQDREKNIETVTNFLSTPTAEKAMRESHFDSAQVRRAIPTLSDQELANLASRSADAQKQFAAGSLTPLEMIIVVIAVVVIIVAIVH